MNALSYPAQEMSSDPGEVKSAARSLELLELFAAHRDGLTLGEVCVLTGWPKSSTLALLRTLRAHDYLSDGNRDHAYRLGHRVAWLGASYLSGINLVQEGMEIVRQVSRQCDETVHLATLRGRDVHYLVKEEGSSHMRMVSAVGTTFPAHGTGVGKTLLSGLSPYEFDALYPPGTPLQKLTPNTITDRTALLAELADIRARGYAYDSGESTVGLQCIAAPVRDATGHIAAAMSVSVPAPRFTDDRIPYLRASILDGTRQLSLRLGYSWSGAATSAGSDAHQLSAPTGTTTEIRR
jgi:IclR family transcriptional regulator, KDG regulon repressor